VSNINAIGSGGAFYILASVSALLEASSVSITSCIAGTLSTTPVLTIMGGLAYINTPSATINL
jgi:ATP-dependent protease HslVU (ClpYQ) peptidase subunit